MRLPTLCLNAVTRWRSWLLLLGFCSLIGPAQALVRVDLPARFERLALRDELRLRIDHSRQLTLAEVMADPQALQAPRRVRFPAGTGAVWTGFALYNPLAHERSLVLLNPQPFVQEIDVYVVRANGEPQHHALGSHRLRGERDLNHRYEVQPLLLQPAETVQIYIRHASTRALAVDTQIFGTSAFLRFAQRDAISWGVFTGLVAALVLYNLVAGFGLKQRVFQYYVLHASLLFAFTLTMQGVDILVWLEPLTRAWLVDPLDWSSLMPAPARARLSHILLMLLTISAGLFALAYFELTQRLRGVARAVQLWIGLALLVCGVELAAFVWPELDAIGAAIPGLAMIFLLGWLALTLLAAWRRLPDWGYYCAGTGSFIVLAMLQDLMWFGLDLPIPELISTYGTPIGLTLELAFLSLGLGQRIRRLTAEHAASERLLMAQSKFMSVGHMLAGVVHQLKRPVIYAGTQLMRLEALLDQPQAVREAALPQALAEMRQTIDFMDKTIVDVYNFYADDTKRQRFSPADQIEHVVSMLTPMTTGSALRIERDLLPEVKLYGYANAFAHAVMIVLENAAQVLKKRAIRQPLIRIGMRCHEKSLEISVSDNGGGIPPERLARIFKLYYQLPDTSGLGVGLVLARRMICERLGGEISASNGPDGAVFVITLSLEP